MQISYSLNPRRIARSLVTVLVLTLCETVVAPVIAPHIATPASHAVSGSIEGSSSTSRIYIIIPAGVDSITLTVTGAGGGKGGNDGNSGAKGGPAGRVVVSFQVTPGDVVGLFPGRAGAPGIDSASKDTGATSGTTLTGNGGAVAGGASTVPGSYFSINGASTQSPDFSGGGGGKVGDTGSSGSGGGGGAASVVSINKNIVAIAAGAGGGGGAGNASNAGGTQGVDSNSSTNQYNGGAGKNSGSGFSCTSDTTDGGGGGGGGGGYFGGAGGNSDLVGNECSGRGGYRGNSFVDASISSSITSFDTSGTPAAPLNGTITYTYDVKPTTTCSPTSQIVDIYTVLKFEVTANCTWTVPSSVSTVDIFAVGGGGGGGGDGGSGGGGGAGLSRTAIPVNANSNLTIKVGYGGNGGLNGARIAGDGDSSTVITSTGALYYAMGGSNGGTRSTAGGAGGATPNNGTFAGGAGGTYAVNSGNIGTVGNYGISNYFYGSQNTYAGGGGGGTYYDSNSNVTGAAGRNGGGAGCSNTAANGMTDGVSGTAGTGGGGGGGGAGNAGRTIGGKGGSGVILIRYATNSADAFPASVASALTGRWTPNELQTLDSGRKGWIDSSGNYANASITGSPIITTQGTLDSGNSTGSSKTNLIVAGGTGDKTTLISGTLSNYTILHVARYPRTTIAGGAMTAGRLITASGGNFIIGHYNAANESNAHHDNGWITPTGTATQYKWLLSTDMSKLYRANGLDLTYKADVAAVSSAVGPTGFGINNYASEPTDWQMQDILVFNRQLTTGEIRAMETYLSRIYGLTLDPIGQTSDTDTASTMGPGSGNYYYFGNLGAGNKLNDVFTIEAWIKPTTDCDSNSNFCQIISKEGTIVFGIQGGYLYWALYGTTVGGWTWTSTGIRINSNEWHHVTMVKQYTGDKNGSLLFYLDGKLGFIQSGTPYPGSGSNNNSTSASYALVDNDDNWLFIGGRSGNTQYFRGDIDEIKVWKIARSAAEIQGDMNSNDGSNSNLQMYYNFNSDVSAYRTTPIVPNLANGGVARSNLYTYYNSQFPTIENRSTTGPYSTITFPRTIITKNGGWKAPTGISQIQTVIVGGGGGGGGGYQGGGGGAGGFIETITSLVAGNIYPVNVGTGGLGTVNKAVTSTTDLWIATNGDTSTAFGLTAVGGGRGASEFDTYNGTAFVNTTRAAQSGGSGGGASWGTGNDTPGSNTSGQGNTGGLGGGGGALFYGGGGGGAGSVGRNGSGTKGGNGGAAKLSQVTGSYLAGGGGGSVRSANATTFIGYGGDTTTSSAQGGGGNGGYSDNQLPGATGGPVNGTANTGGGGGAGLSTAGNGQGYGAAGGSGLVALRYITATVPAYTKPTNAYLNVGMTETFTTNVAADSATAGLTRTFKWESTTAGVSGTYTTLKVGTGASNAAYSWVPSDTSTTGSNYLYRLTVTDSDTSGLFITDSSTAFAVINPALKVTSTAAGTSLTKKINISRSETYTITLGTPTYRATLTPVIPGITIDTSTASTVVLKISDTASVGTWLETLTVTDSVSASLVFPLIISVAAPPTLLNTNEIVTNGLVFNLDAGNSASLLLSDVASTSGTTWSDLSGRKNNATTGAGINTGGYSSTGCTAPNYSNGNGGAIVITASSDNCFYSTLTGREFEKSYTFEAWFKTSATIPAWGSIISQGYTSGSVPISVAVGSMGGSTLFVGFYDGYTWRYPDCGFTPTIGQWTHIAGTYDGTTMRTFINGSNIVNGAACSVAFTGGFAAALNSNGMIIGKGHMGGTGGYTFPGSIASIRLYNTPLTATQILQNYNATKYRFDSSNQTLIKPTKKYGTLVLESFTATSGSDTRTATFATGNRSGISWDTTTVANQIQLSIQDSLSAGTYYDTVTVTDNLGQSTYLPITFTVTKADTLTVSMESATSVSYNANPITIYPRTIIKGLKSSDTATSLTRFASTLYSESTVVPTNADTYTVRGAEPVFSIGSLSNYQGVIYETTTAVVNKIRQRALNIFKYGGTVGTSFVISLQGGDGTGAVTETLTGVSTVTGCAISNHVLSATEQKQGFCEVRVVKAGDQNYFAETETAQLYFLMFVNNQLSTVVGSGSTIALNGVTSFETSTIQAPSITGLSTLTLSLGAGGTFTITGTGFTGSITVKFVRNKSISVTSSNGTTIDIPVGSIASSGAVTGRIAIITAAGEAVSVDTLTITP